MVRLAFGSGNYAKISANTAGSTRIVMGVAWGWESTCLHATFPALSPPFPTYYGTRSQILIVSSFLGEGT